MHATAKAQIKECYEKNKSGDPQFSSLTTSMKARLRATVGESYWKKAHDYLDHFLRRKKQSYAEQQRQRQAGPPPQRGVGGGQGGAAGGQGPSGPSAGPQRQMTSRHVQPHGNVPNLPPPIVKTAPPPRPTSRVPQPPLHTMTQVQMSAAAASKTPIANRNLNPPATVSNAASPPSTAQTSVVLSSTMAQQQPPTHPLPTAKQSAAEKKAADAAKLKARRNAVARERRAKKKEKDAKEAAAAKERKAKAAAAGKAGTQAGTGAGAVGGGIGFTGVGVAGLGSGNLPTGSGISHAVQQQSLPQTAPSASTPVAALRATLPAVTSAVIPSADRAAAAADLSTTKMKKIEPPKKKPKKKAAPAPSKTTGPPKRKLSSSTLQRDHRTLMETVDHAVAIDVQSLPHLLSSKEHKFDVQLDEEQRVLLYGDKGEERRARVQEICRAARDAAGEQYAVTQQADRPPPLPWRLPAAYEGWGTNNVVTVRNAWAKIRLPESVVHKQKVKQKEGSGTDGVAERLPSAEGFPPSAMRDGSVVGHGATETSPLIEEDTTNHVWYDEQRATHDPTLALLSEAAEVFLKSAIEKAIGRARLRMNLDGVRLWHLMHARSAVQGVAAKTSSAGRPQVLLRLGCDVQRQIALAEGNAAKTYQRMEEALSRRNDSNPAAASLDTNPRAMLAESSSMSDLSKRPPLKSAVKAADEDAKRKFAVFGGINSKEPPFGRVPKKAKVVLQDIVEGSEIVGGRRRTSSMTGTRRKRFQVGLRY